MKLQLSSFLLLGSSFTYASPIINLEARSDGQTNSSLINPLIKRFTPVNDKSYVRFCGVAGYRTKDQEWVYVEGNERTYIVPKSPQPIDVMKVCADKGKSIYEKILARKVNDGKDRLTENPDRLTEYYVSTIIADQTKFKDHLPSMLAPIGIDGKHLYRPVLTKAKGGTDDAYQNYYNVNFGTIIADFNFVELDNNKDTANRKEEKSLSWSEIVFRQYKGLAGEISAPMDRLKYCVRKDIINSETRYVLQQAVATKYGGKEDLKDFAGENADWASFKFETFKPMFTAADQKLFWAILGTDNLSACGFLLADHANAIQKYDIARIGVGDFSTVMEYKPYA